MRKGHCHNSNSQRSAPGGVCAIALVLTSLYVSAGCTVADSEIPAISGPSELGLSIQLTATPDVLPLDGASQSLIRIFARNARGEPVSGLAVRLHIVTSRGFEDFGQLSARSVVTASDGRAAATYTVPLGGPVDLGGQILIQAVPVGTNAGEALGRTVLIRLVPPGTVIPPANFSAGFGFTPDAPNEFDQVLFTTRCTSNTDTNCVQDPNGLVVAYNWDFGDGSTGTGSTTTHAYTRAASYVVKLTIADAYGRAASATRVIDVGQGQQPAAAFRFSPENPRVSDSVFFNASETIPAPGTQITSYSWDFGDGATGSGLTVSHTYNIAGEYRVTLTVRDNRGAINSTSQPLTVAESRPTAAFTFSPSSPAVGTSVFFDASTSRASTGRRIVDYTWSFGDGIRANGLTVRHTYTAAGIYNVALTVTDNVGEFSTTSQTLTVGGTGTGPTAGFNVSPEPSLVNQSVVVDARPSTPSPGATITRYSWNWGDGATIDNTSDPTFSHTYTRTGIFTITLTVTDSFNRTATTTRSHTVN